MTESTLGSEYASADDDQFETRYRASCHCGAVCYEVAADPVDAKICHCRECQVLHGAPMQWAVIFHKRDVRFTIGEEHLKFYHAPNRREAHRQPCKVACRLCGTPIADEGRRMWLAFPSLFEFETLPGAFRPSAHIFYDSRIMDVDDVLPKWSGHKGQSRLVG